MKSSNKIIKYINENFEKLIVPDGNIQIGIKYPYSIGEKGAVMELLPEGPYFIKLVVDELNNDDINKFREGDIIFKVLFNSDKAYILLRFGESNLLHEILFNPTLYKNQENTKKIMKESNLIYCVLIDGENEKIQGIKLFNFPLDIFEKLTSVWEKAFENINYTEDFKAYMTNFFSEDILFWWENIS
jgi:hypothetical protein